MLTLCYLSLNPNPRKQMAKERQKWTTEEEEALFSGVEKHGQGKWKIILTDPQFASTLANRSNIDLKDKWRNISVNRDKVKTSISEEEEVTTKTDPPPLDSHSPKPLSVVVPLIEYGGTGTPAPSRTTIDRRIAPDYEAMILEALCYNEDPNGADADAIISFIQERYELPENFKRSVTSMLRRLVLTGELEKADNNFKIHRGAYYGADSAPVPLQEEHVGPSNDDKHDDEEQEAKASNDDDDDDDKHDDEEEDEVATDDDDCDSPVATETIEDATMYAVNAVARAENKLQEAIEAIEDAHRFEKLLEESTALQMLAEELHERCVEEGRVLLKP